MFNFGKFNIGVSMNFNMNLNLDKAMNALSTNKTLRIWSYIVIILIIIALFVCFGGDFFKGLADLVRAIQGR